MIKKVIKRDGYSIPFRFSRIRSAVVKAFAEVGQKFPSALSKQLNAYIEETADGKETANVEDIQNCVEKFLMQNDCFDAAKAFIVYRAEHKKTRDAAENNIEFIDKFVTTSNAANATIDDNSNVGTHGIGVLNAEIHKKNNQDTNLLVWEKKIHETYPEIKRKQFRKDINTILYIHDSSSQILEGYCMAVSMFPFLLHGIKGLGGKSATPKSLESFCGIYPNMVFALSSEIKGACATPEFLMYFAYYCEKAWGENFFRKSDKIITTADCLKQQTIGTQIDQYFQHVTYSINQIAGSRGMQSPFTNFSLFDKYFFDGMFGDFQFPNGDKPHWEATNWIQQRYLHWLNQERLHCILTFPVCSYACLVDDKGEFRDKDTFKFICQEYSEGDSFFTYLSKSVDSLSSCCRLQNAVQDNQFNFTNGQIGVMTGSKSVITLNLSRIIQDWCKSIDKKAERGSVDWSSSKSSFFPYLKEILERVYKYQTVYNNILHWENDNNLMAAYKDGFINLDKQFLTVGINGLNQAAEFMNIVCGRNEQYREFCGDIFGYIKEQNTLHKTKHEQFNTEQVPAESAAIKLYNRDKKDGYWVPEDTNLYASYIFKPNDESLSVFDKIYMHSDKFAADKLDGGAACHINLDSHLSEPQYEHILKYAAKVGCKYFTFNVPNCECDDCGYIAKQPFDVCPECGSTHISAYDRIIGYLTKISDWSAGRQTEQKTRAYNNTIQNKNSL